MSQDKMKGGHKAVPRMPHTKTKGTKGTEEIERTK